MRVPTAPNGRIEHRYRSSALAIGVIVLLLCPTSNAGAQTAEGTGLSPRDIVERALDTNMLGFQSGDAQLRLTSTDRNGRSRERVLHVRSLEVEGLARALIRVVSPPDMAGQSYLFVRNRNREDDIWVFMPALDDAPRRIYGDQKNNLFMGTNISYRDLESRDIQQATYMRQADEEFGPAGFDVYVIDAVPNEVDESGYTRVRMWIRQTDYIPLRIRFFGADDAVRKTLFTEQVDQVQGRTFVRQLSIVDDEDASTRIIIETIDFEADVQPSEFTEENLVH